jgi:hypothetical protein
LRYGTYGGGILGKARHCHSLKQTDPSIINSLSFLSIIIITITIIIIMSETDVQPLARGQQLMLQRLLAAHVLTDDQAKTLYQELQEADDNDDDASQQDPPQTLEEAFQEINAQLTTAFGLEVATVSMKLDTTHHTKYHAIINQHADGVAKQAFGNSFTPHERSMIRLILEKLVNDDGAEDDNNAPSSCQRKDLVNLRADLVEPYKLSLQGAEHLVETLVQEQWLVVSVEATQSRRDSMKATLQLGPRSFLELSHLLTDLGFPQDDLPQFIFHRM